MWYLILLWGGGETPARSNYFYRLLFHAHSLFVFRLFFVSFFAVLACKCYGQPSRGLKWNLSFSHYESSKKLFKKSALKLKLATNK